LLRKFTPFLLFIFFVAFYLLSFKLTPFGYIDDAFISFRYARNLMEGHGLVYNIGERVEGYSNTLFVLLLAGCGRLGLQITWAAMLLGITFHAATIALTFAYLRRMLPKSSTPLRVQLDRDQEVAPTLKGKFSFQPLSVFALLFLALHPTGVAYAQAGMETSLAALLLLSAVYLTTVSVERGRTVTLPILAGLATVALGLTRPEGIAMAAPLGLWLLLGNKEGRWSRAVPFSAVVFVLFGAFLLWRHSYFGYWQPNTYYAKAAGAGLSLLRVGLRYFWRFANVTLLPYLFLPAFALVLRYRRRMPIWLFSIGSTALVYLLLVIWLGGDHFPLARFFVPAIPLLLIFLAGAGRLVRGALNAEKPQLAQVRLRPLAWIIAAVLLPLTIIFGMLFRNEGLIFTGQVKLTRTWCDTGRQLKEAYPPDTSVALIPIGAIGYCSKLPIVDLVGLVDTRIAHTPTDLSRSMIGHGRFNSRYVLEEKKPKLVLPLLNLLDHPAPEWLIRRGLQHLAIKDLMDQRRFFDDYAFHRLEVGNTFFHYFARRDFEPPDSHSGVYPVDGVPSPIPEREPLAGDTLREKIFGKDVPPDEPFDVPQNPEVML